MKHFMMMVLAMAAILAAQMGLSEMVGFHTAEIMGKTAMTALYLYAVIRMCRAFRVKRGE